MIAVAATVDGVAAGADGVVAAAAAVVEAGACLESFLPVYNFFIGIQTICAENIMKFYYITQSFLV